ncbi:MAG: T9SS type A sorting domain-containing protein [Chitinophagales bacterium]
MKKQLTLFALLACFLGSATAQRYLTPQFANVKVTKDVVYGSNLTYSSIFTLAEDLTMDVYEPDGDTVAERPVIILGHAGSYLTLYQWGVKEQYSVVEMCNRFAKLGYVAVSIKYRVGWEAGSSDAETREKTIINAVYRAMQDFKTCVRYFKKNANEGGNQWKINPCKIFIGGTNSGGYSALAVANLNKQSELMGVKFLDSQGNPYINQSKTGDFDGFGGTENLNNHAGYNSLPAAVLALGAATGDTTWVEQGELPTVALHGMNETTTPYNTAIVITGSGSAIIVVSGPGDFMPRVERLGNNDVFKNASLQQGPANKNGAGQFTQPVEGLYPFYGEKFEPWSWYDSNQPVGDPALNPNASETKAKKYIDTIMAYTAPRFKAIIDNNTPCQILSSVKAVDTKAVSFTLLPNPAAATLTVIASETNANIATVTLFDFSGKVVLKHHNESGYYAAINTENLANGMYMVETITASGAKDVRKLVIQH